jgi:hypothetical protein
MIKEMKDFKTLLFLTAKIIAHLFEHISLCLSDSRSTFKNHPDSVINPAEADVSMTT